MYCAKVQASKLHLFGSECLYVYLAQDNTGQDRPISTTATTTTCAVYANELLTFDLSLNNAFMPELVRAQSIGAKVYIWYQSAPNGNVI